VRLVLPILAAIVLTLALVLALIPQLKPGAPRGAGQCYQRVSADPQAFQLVADKSKSIEHCAGYLEAIRTEKLKTEELVGGYQGFYVIARPEGIYYTRDLKKFPVRALVRTDDGKLAAPGVVDACYAGQGPTLHKVAERLKLGACVERLFDKVCLEPGQTSYGAWSGTTLRLADGRVEQGGRDGIFRPLVTQQPPDCALPIAD
jgi:hypothetical protein